MTAHTDRVYFKLQRAAHTLNKAADQALIKAAGVTTAQAAVMTIIDKEKQVSQKAIAEQLGLNEPALTAMACRLEKMGYIQRARSPSDGRALQLSLTQKGRNAFGKIASPFATINAAFDAAINADDMAVLAKNLSTIADLFSKK